MHLDLKIRRLIDETSRIRIFELEAARADPLPSYSAGAHLSFDLGTHGTRSYSLIDWPDQSDPALYRIAVQNEPEGTGGSRRMHELQIGDMLCATPPQNDFALARQDGPTVMLAGGIGITPMISMATALNQAGKRFSLHYAARSRAVAGFASALTSHFGAAVALHFDDETPLDIAALMQSLSGDTHLYICGPKPMIGVAQEAARLNGLPNDQIHVELFTNKASDDDTAFEVEISSSGQVFTIPAGQTIIDVLEAAGLDLIYDCQRGDCGICQTDVITGDPDHRDVVLSYAEKADGKVMQICVSRAKSPRLVLDL